MPARAPRVRIPPSPPAGRAQGGPGKAADAQRGGAARRAGWDSQLSRRDGRVVEGARLGGSDSLSIRPTEGQGSVEQYCEFESYSLRHVVRDSGESAAGARADGEFPAIPRGFGRAPGRTPSGDGLVRRLTAPQPSFFSAADCGGSGRDPGGRRTSAPWLGDFLSSGDTRAKPNRPNRRQRRSISA